MKEDMIEPEAVIPMRKQCEMLDISRGYFYYHPVELSNEDLKAMEKIDEHYTENPARGTRRMNKALRKRFHIKAGRVKGPAIDGNYGHSCYLPKEESVHFQQGP